MTKYLAAPLLAAASLSLGACNGLYGDDEFARYVQRSDKITLSAGDAKEVNAATHTIHPWPRGVGDPRIPANGEKMVHAIERYRTPGQPAPPPGSVTTQTTSTTETSGTGATTQSETTTVPTPPAGPGSY
jgi:hypothetical protein